MLHVSILISPINITVARDFRYHIRNIRIGSHPAR